jgi:aspartate-semialdehyde dehydrogenase
MVSVGVVGATGQVGQVVRQLLLERNFPLDSVPFLCLLQERRNDLALW